MKSLKNVSVVFSFRIFKEYISITLEVDDTPSDIRFEGVKQIDLLKGGSYNDKNTKNFYCCYCFDNFYA